MRNIKDVKLVDERQLQLDVVGIFSISTRSKQIEPVLESVMAPRLRSTIRATYCAGLFLETWGGDEDSKVLKIKHHSSIVVLPSHVYRHWLCVFFELLPECGFDFGTQNKIPLSVGACSAAAIFTLLLFKLGVRITRSSFNIVYLLSTCLLCALFAVSILADGPPLSCPTRNGCLCVRARACAALCFGAKGLSVRQRQEEEGPAASRRWQRQRRW